MNRGKYFYAPHRSKWGIWRRDNEQDEGVNTGTFITDYPTKEEAAKEVYRLNGWTYNK